MTTSPTSGYPALDRKSVLAWTLIIAATTVVIAVLRGNSTLADPDTQWHIATGRLIWETGALPIVDTMSHTHAGQPWIAKEWLSQLILFGTYSVAGWTGVLALSAAALSAAVSVVAWRLLQTWPPLLVTIISWMVASSLLPIALARPHLLALASMALFTVMLTNAAEGDRKPPWLALPVLTLWANLHAAFTLGLIIAACLALDAILRARPEERARLVVLWGAFGFGCVAACCIHPYGLQSLLINIEMMRGNEGVPLINEWAPHPLLDVTTFRVVIPALFIAYLFDRNWRMNLGRILLGGFFLYLTLKHVRFVMVLAVVTPIICRDTASAAISALLKRLNLFQGHDPLRDPRWRMPIAIGCTAAFAASLVGTESARPPETAAPVAALASVPLELRAQPVYNSYDYGGFLVLNGIPTFIDGRTDQLFIKNFMARFHGYLKNGDNKAFLAFIESYKPRWALVQAGKDDGKALEQSPDWKEIYADSEAKVFVRVGG
ncbi:MAG: hypothetical protein ACRCTI_05565 [Beijerinckiaceae bacterium]